MTFSGGLKKKSRAVLAGLVLPDSTESEHQASMDELERLVKTLGFETVGRVSQKRQYPSAGTIFGKGKLKELACWTGGPGTVQGFKKGLDTDEDDEYEEQYEYMGSEEWDEDNGLKEKATIAIIDCELTPTQLSNLQEATGVEVLDRTGVILEIFSRHAKSREARLQVEIAKLNYLAPRLRVARVGGDRQGGGIGAKGSGETSHELDRRRIRDRIAELRNQLKSIRTEQITRRSNRQELPLVALIGYTNAGKSSLMRQLTKSGIEGENKLFATLDTTVRVLQPPSVPRILVSDTVGFIKKLPHDLVASFRSTLDEALSASLLLYVVDGSDPNFRLQLEVTREVIKDIGADSNPAQVIINKVDLIDEAEINAIRKEFPDAIFVSAINPEDIKRIRETIQSFFEKDMTDADILVPYTNSQLLGKIRTKARVLKETFEENGIIMKVRAAKEVHNWIDGLL